MGSYIKIFEIGSPPSAPRPTLNISVGNGIFYVTVSDPNKDPKNKNAFKYSFKAVIMREFIKKCNVIKEANPGSKNGLILSKWDDVKNTMVIDHTIMIEKNERELFNFIINNNTEHYEFPLVVNSKISDNSDRYPEKYRSLMALDDFIKSIEIGMNYLPLSRLDGLNILGGEKPKFESKQYR